MSEAMTVQDTNDPWGAEPADRWVKICAEIHQLLWHRNGNGDVVEGLPPIPCDLAIRMDRFGDQYNALDSANARLPGPFFAEERSDFPLAAFNEEGRCIARQLKAALPDDWTVVYQDVDAWLRPKGEPLESRQLILAGTPASDHGG